MLLCTGGQDRCRRLTLGTLESESRLGAGRRGVGGLHHLLLLLLLLLLHGGEHLRLLWRLAHSGARGQWVLASVHDCRCNKIGFITLFITMY